MVRLFELLVISGFSIKKDKKYGQVIYNIIMTTEIWIVEREVQERDRRVEEGKCISKRGSRFGEEGGLVITVGSSFSGEFLVKVFLIRG